MASNLEFPPQAMTSASNTLQGTYSDGVYIATSSSTYYDLSSFAFGAFDKVIGTGYQQFWRSAGQTYNLSYTGSNLTYADNVPYYGEWLQVQMPNAVTVKSYRIAAKPDALQEAPKSWRLVGSMDGGTWYTLDARQNVSFTSNTYNVYNLPQNNLYYTHLRLVVLSTGDLSPPDGLGVATVGEVKFFGTIPYGVKDGAIEMAFYNRQYFPNVTADDMVIRTTDPSQKIHFGTLSNSMPALTISSNSMIVGSNAYVLKRMAVGKSNAEYDLDVIGNINFTGSLYRNGQFYAGDIIVAGDGIWNSNEYGVVYSGANVGIHVPVPEYRVDIRAGLGEGSNTKGLRIATEGSNNTVGDALVLSENAGSSNFRQAIQWNNTNVDYTKARIWTETGADYSNTRFEIEVADSNQQLQPRMVIDVEGKVGVGTENPEANLHVVGDAIITSNIIIGGNLTTGSAIQFQGLVIGKNTGTTANFSPFSVPGVSNELGGSLAFYSQCNDSSGIRILNGNLEELARFTNNGNFGLGDTTPGDIFSIEDSNPRIGVYSYTGFANGATSAIGLFNTNSNLGFEFNFNKDSNMLYLHHYNSSFAAAPLMAMDNSNEYVGIRTVFPAAPLVVSGRSSNGVLKVTNDSVNTGDQWWIGFDLGNTNSRDTNDRARIGAMNTFTSAGELFFTTGQPGLQQERLRIDQYGRIGINTTSPSNAFLDVNSNLNATAAVMGEKTPVALICDPAAVAFNAYNNNGWKRARGYQGQAKYGAMVELVSDSGQLRFLTTNSQSNDGDSFNSTCVMRIHAATSNVYLLGNVAPPNFDHSNKVVPYDYKSSLVLDSYFTSNNGDMGRAAGGVEFRVRNSTGQVWSAGHVIGAADPLSNNNYRGGMCFFTQPGSGDSNLGWTDERTRGAQPKLSLLLNHNQDALFYGNVGINEQNPSAKLHVNGDILYTGVTKTAAIARMTPVYIRGTGLNNTANRVVDLGNVVLTLPQTRGLTLTIINTADHSHVSSTNYDTYGFATDADNLATALNNLTRDRFGILTSWDAFEDQITNNLRNAAVRLGLHKLAGVPRGDRRPYAAIFKGCGVGTGNTQVNNMAMEVCQGVSAGSTPAVIATTLVEDAFIGNNLHNALLAGDPNLTIPAVFAGSNANVGIGTIAPAYPLHIHRTSGFTGIQMTNDIDATKFLNIGVNASSHFLVGNGNHPMTFATNAVEAMRINSNGTLAIGTSNTVYGKLFVSGDAVIGADSGANSLVINDVAGAKWKMSTGTYDLTFSKHTGSTNTDYSAWTTRVVMGDGGSIGIGGMAEPAARLHIYTSNDYTGDVFRFDAKNEPSVYQLGMTANVPVGGVVTWGYFMKNASVSFSNVQVFDRGNVGFGNSAPTERVSIDRNLSLGTAATTAGPSNYHVRVNTWKYGGLTVYNGDNTGSLNYNITTNADTTLTWRWRFCDGSASAPNTDYFYVQYPSGNYYFRGISVSDRRVKANIQTIDSRTALSKIEQLQGVTYNPKETNNAVNTSITRGGFIAQEVATVLPELVNHDAEVEERVSDDEYKAAYGVDYNGVIAYLTEAVKELSQQNKELRSRLDELEKRVQV